MKKLFKIAIFFLIWMPSSYKGVAQSPTYNTCASLSNFNGEWKFEANGTIIKFYFKAHTFFVPNTNEYVENLLGWHEYSVNGQVVESDYSHRFDNIPSNFHNQSDVPISIKLNFELCKPVLTSLYGGFFDITRNLGHTITLKLLTTNTAEIRLGPSESTLTPTMIGYTLPQVFILTRQ